MYTCILLHLRMHARAWHCRPHIWAPCRAPALCMAAADRDLPAAIVGAVREKAATVRALRSKWALLARDMLALATGMRTGVMLDYVALQPGVLLELVKELSAWCSTGEHRCRPLLAQGSSVVPAEHARRRDISNEHGSARALRESVSDCFSYGSENTGTRVQVSTWWWRAGRTAAMSSGGTCWLGAPQTERQLCGSDSP